MLLYAALTLIGIAVYLVASTIISEEERFKTAEQLEEKKNKVDDNKYGTILKFSRPFIKRYTLPYVTKMKNKQKIREKYKKKIATAGLTAVLTADEAYAFKLFLAAAFPVLFIALREFLGESWSLAFMPVMAVVGFQYPDIWMNGLIKTRKSQIIMGMPFVVDMLALSVEAGLDFMAAITKVVAKAPRGPIVEEFEQLIKETRVGVPRAEGLRSLGWRVDVIQVSSFCATLIAADSVGANIAPLLKQLSAEIRQKRSAEAEKAGATAAGKILFPMMFLIIPAVFLVIMAPLALQLMQGSN